MVGDLQRTADDRIGLALSRVFDRARAYLRGYLEGGYVEAFFRNDVPRLELAEDAVYHALVRSAPDLDRELGEPLARAATDALTALAAPPRSLGRRRRCPGASISRSASAARSSSPRLGYDRPRSPADAARHRTGSACIPNRLTLGIDEAGRGPSIGPMVMAAVALDSRAAAVLTRKGLRDSKAYGAGDDAHAIRCDLAAEIRARAKFVATIEVEHDRDRRAGVPRRAQRPRARARRSR